MVPASITVLEGMPLTANGKIDRKALPVPEQAAADLFEAPQGEAEQALAAVWADLFGLERAGRHDDFFALGGDSILALKLVARARKRGVKLTPKQLFTGKTPAGVARLVEGRSPAPSRPKARRPCPGQTAVARCRCPLRNCANGSCGSWSPPVRPITSAARCVCWARSMCWRCSKASTRWWRATSRCARCSAWAGTGRWCR